MAIDLTGQEKKNKKRNLRVTSYFYESSNSPEKRRIGSSSLRGCSEPHYANVILDVFPLGIRERLLCGGCFFENARSF